MGQAARQWCTGRGCKASLLRPRCGIQHANRLALLGVGTAGPSACLCCVPALWPTVPLIVAPPLHSLPRRQSAAPYATGCSLYTVSGCLGCLAEPGLHHTFLAPSGTCLLIPHAFAPAWGLSAAGLVSAACAAAAFNTGPVSCVHGICCRHCHTCGHPLLLPPPLQPPLPLPLPPPPLLLFLQCVHLVSHCR